MSIFIEYPTGKEIEVYILDFNPTDYSEWEFNTPILYDGEKLTLRFSDATLLERYNKILKDANIKSDYDLFMLRSDDIDIQHARDFVLERKTKLDLSRSNITSLEGCPQGLTELDLNSCESLTSLEGCPQGLKELYLSWCKSLTSLEGCPQGLKELDLSWCYTLTSLEGYPQGLTELDLTGCTLLTSLGGCPQGLTKINLRFCRSLTSLEGCPPHIYDELYKKYNLT